MLRKFAICTVALAAGLAIFSDAEAAVLSSVQGKVSVNQGSGYKPAGAGMQVGPGDQVMTGQDGVATISYGAGCAQTVGSGEVLVIPATPVCAAAGGVNTGAVVVGGLVVAGGVAAAVALSGGDSKKKNPISP